MNYSQQEFLALMEAIEAQDGKHLDVDCSPDTFRLKKSPDGPERAVRTQACHNPAIFEVPYPLADDSPTVNMGTIRACAVCDNIGMWPRFQQALGGIE